MTADVLAQGNDAARGIPKRRGVNRDWRFLKKPRPGDPRPGRYAYGRESVAARAAAVAVAATTTARALARLSFVHLKGTTLKVLAVERLHGAGSVCV